MSTTCLVSFTLRNPGGAVLPNAKAVFVPVGPDVAAVGIWTVPRERVEVTTNALGQASVALVGGSWTVTFMTSLGQKTAAFDCPASGSANLETLIGQSLIAAYNAIQLAVLAAGGRGLFETPAAGRAATVNGEIFLAPLSPSGVGIYRRDSAGSSPQIGTYFTGEATQNPLDTTPGRLTRVGDFGLGGLSVVESSNDANAIPIGVTAFRQVNAFPSLNSPFDFPVIINIARSVGRSAQLAMESLTALAPRAAIRVLRDDGNGPWSEIFHQRFALGTVSQVAGVPTGRLREPVNNANGRAERDFSGSMECWRETLSAPNANIAAGSRFRSADVTWTFPSAFLAGSTPVVTGSVVDADCDLRLVSVSNTQAVFRVMSDVSKSGALTILAHAKGRWSSMT